MAWVVPIAAAVGEAAGAAGSAIGGAASAIGSTVGGAASSLASLFGGEGAAGAAEAAAGAAPEAAAAGIVPEAAAVAPAAAAATPPGFLSTIGGAVKSLLPGPTGIPNLAQGLESFFGGSPEAAPGFVGPPAAWAGPGVTGPGFLGGFVQGLTGKYTPAGAPSGASAAGGGLGQLVSFLNQMHGSAPQAAPMGPIVRTGGMPTAPFTTLIPQTQPTEVATGPIMKLLAHL